MIDKYYRITMLAAMVLELILLSWIAVSDSRPGASCCGSAVCAGQRHHSNSTSQK